MPSSDFDFCHFQPWVGPSYAAAGVAGLRLMVLGESHYSWPEMDPAKERETTRIVVRDEIAGAHHHPFLARVAEVVLGPAQGRSRSQETEFLNAVAFYNYVQEFVGGRPRIRPTAGAWKRAQAYLPQVLDTLQPDLVVACGRQLYEHLKRIPDFSSDGVFGADKLTPSRCLPLGNGRKAVLGLIYHPASWGFRVGPWHRRFLEYAERARSLKALVAGG